MLWTAKTRRPASSAPSSSICSPASPCGCGTASASAPPTGRYLVVNDRGVVGRALRRPVFATLVELWVSKAIDVEDGSLFDIFERRPQGKLTGAKLRSLPEAEAAARPSRARLLDEPRHGRADGLAGHDPFVSGSNKEAITHHYDISNAFYRLFLDERMVYSCGYFTDFTNGIDQAQADKLDHICRKLQAEARRHACSTSAAAGARC